MFVIKNLITFEFLFLKVFLIQLLWKVYYTKIQLLLKVYYKKFNYYKKFLLHEIKTLKIC